MLDPSQSQISAAEGARFISPRKWCLASRVDIFCLLPLDAYLSSQSRSGAVGAVTGVRFFASVCARR